MDMKKCVFSHTDWCKTFKRDLVMSVAGNLKDSCHKYQDDIFVLKKRENKKRGLLSSSDLNPSLP